jgi:hypothetical protein
MTMRTTGLIGMMAVVCLLAVHVGGCAGTKMTSKRLCESTGGTYSAGACNPGKAMKGEELCAQAGGIYSPDEDTCALPR